MIKQKLSRLIEEIEAYTRMVKYKRRDQVYMFKEIAFLATKAAKVAEERRK